MRKPKRKTTVDLLKRLDGMGATLNAEKCEFSKKEVKFVGYVLNEEGIKPEPEKTEWIQDMDTPQNVSDVRRFLGMVREPVREVCSPHAGDLLHNFGHIFVRIF